MLQPRICLRLGRSAVKATPKYAFGSSISHQRLRTLPTRQFTSASTLRNEAQPPTPAKDEEFVPQPLGRPIGFPTPPRPGDNSGSASAKKQDYSGMTLKERNLAKRADIVEQWGTFYFRDFKNIRKYREGKTFLANPRIFKKEVSMYFPNLHGDTLEGSKRDIVNVLRGKITVVSLYSSAWGEAQVKTFTGTSENPELHQVLKEEAYFAQQVNVNVEENTMKAWIVQAFAWRERLARKKEDWGKYFLVRKGMSRMVRESIGALNGRVGYVYLVDADCKIRWAGSANAEGTEKEDLVKGLRKCLQEVKNPQSMSKSRPIPRTSGAQPTAATA